MGKNEESPDGEQDQLVFKHLFRQRSIVPVEWYSQAQLEYLAQKIRMSASIDGLLLPIPKTLINSTSQYLVACDDGELKKKTNAPRVTTQRTSSTSANDSSGLPKISKAIFSDKDTERTKTEDEDGAVTCILRHILDEVGNPKSIYQGDHSGAESKNGDGETLAAKPIIEPVETSDTNNQLAEIESNAVSKPSETAGILKIRTSFGVHLAVANLFDLTHEVTCVDKINESPEGPRQRFYRRKRPLLPDQSENRITMETRLMDATKETCWDRNLAKKFFEKELLFHSDDYDVSRLWPSDWKTRKLDERTINALRCQMNNETSQSPTVETLDEIDKPEAATSSRSIESLSSDAIQDENARDNNQGCIQGLSAIESRIMRKLIPLIYKSAVDYPAEEILDDASRTIIQEIWNDVQHIKYKTSLLMKKRSLEGTLREEKKSAAQKLEPNEAQLEFSLPQKRRFVGQSPKAGTKKIDVRILQPEQTKSARRITLAPGAYVRVHQTRTKSAASPCSRSGITSNLSVSSESGRARRITATSNASIPFDDTSIITSVPPANRSIVMRPFIPQGPSNVSPSANFAARKMVTVAIPSKSPSNATVVSSKTAVGLTTNNIHPGSAVSTTHTPCAVSLSEALGSPVPIIDNSKRILTLESYGTQMPQQSKIQTNNGPQYSLIGSKNSKTESTTLTSNGQNPASPRRLIQLPGFRLPMNKSNLVQNSRLVMVTPGQLTTPQQITVKNSVPRIQHIQEQTPTRGSIQLESSGQATAVTNLKINTMIPVALSTPHLNSQTSDQAVLFAPSFNFQVIRPAATLSPRYFTVKQQSIERQPGPLN